jgi:hypothetical protein
MKPGAGSWDQLRETYLREMARALEKADHPRKDEVLEDVHDELRQRFEELPADERTPERLAELVDEMGTPEERLDSIPHGPASPVQTLGRNLPLAFIVAALVVGLLVALLILL